jgi:hypothetical protein
VKCIIDPASGEPCKRCAKAGRQCIVTPPTRKRQKKADSRVAELERKIDALTATLAAREGVAQYENGYPDIKRQADSASPYTQGSPQYQADQRLLGTHDPHSSPKMTRGSVRPHEGPDKRRRLEPIDTIKLVSGFAKLRLRLRQGARLRKHSQPRLKQGNLLQAYKSSGNLEYNVARGFVFFASAWRHGFLLGLLNIPRLLCSYMLHALNVTNMK